MRTSESPSNIVKLSDIRRGRERALSPYGPVRAGLTTSQTIQDRQLMELLSSLESVVASLNSKSCTALDTLESATKILRAEPCPSITDEAGTDETS